MNSSENYSVLLTACFFRLREGNDNPHRMDYQGCEHPLPTLYPLRPEGIRGYFSDNVASAVDIGIDLSSVSCSVESTLHALAAKGGFLCPFRVIGRQRVMIQQAGF